MERKVVFIHRVTCDYSEAFLVKVHAALKEHGIEFSVVSGQPWEDEALIDVVSHLPFGYSCPNRKIIGSLYWSDGALAHTKGTDLVIIEQLNSAIHNYVLLFSRHFRSLLGRRKSKYKLAYYGHGLNLNSQSATIRNWWKKRMSLWVDWWFAYTEFTRKIIYKEGYNNITVMNNTVDTTSLANEVAKYSKEDLGRLYREVFGADVHYPTAVFCGRLVERKGVPFLLESAEIIKRALPDFRMLIIGSGPDAKLVEEFCKENEWCKYIGLKTGIDKVKYLLLGDVWLNPGYVGLAIVDSFTVGLPHITTDNNIHSPEIAYLENGKNGIITEPSVGGYAESVIKLFNNPSFLEELKAGALKSSEKYSIDNMVSNFVDGILKCINKDIK